MEIDDLISVYEDGPELKYDFASTLYMIQRGKHYDIEKSKEIILRLSKNALELSKDLEQLAEDYGND